MLQINKDSEEKEINTIVEDRGKNQHVSPGPATHSPILLVLPSNPSVGWSTIDETLGMEADFASIFTCVYTEQPTLLHRHRVLVWLMQEQLPSRLDTHDHYGIR